MTLLTRYLPGWLLVVIFYVLITTNGGSVYVRTDYGGLINIAPPPLLLVLSAVMSVILFIL